MVVSEDIDFLQKPWPTEGLIQFANVYDHRSSCELGSFDLL